MEMHYFFLSFLEWLPPATQETMPAQKNLIEALAIMQSLNHIIYNNSNKQSIKQTKNRQETEVKAQQND